MDFVAFLFSSIKLCFVSVSGLIVNEEVMEIYENIIPKNVMGLIILIQLSVHYLNWHINPITKKY